MERISVIIPVYNTEEYLAQCLDSVIGQSYSNIEVILVDDGSSDTSGRICDDYSRKDSRVRVVHQKNGGVSRARNAGIDLANGEFISFIDADDTIRSNHFHALYSLLEQSNSDISICGVNYTQNPNRELASMMNQSGSVREMSGIEAVTNMLYQKGIDNGPVAKLYKRNLFATVRFREEMAFAEDLDINYRIFRKAKRVVVNSLETYLYRQRSGSAMHSTFNLRRMDGQHLLSDMLIDVEPENPTLAIKNRLFIESVVVAREVYAVRRQYRDEFRECVRLIKKTRLDVVRDRQSRLRFRVYAGMSLVGVHALILFFVIKKRITQLKGGH